MKKLTVILMMLILTAGMVFASNTVTLNSEVAAGTGATRPGDNSDIIGGGDEQGFWLTVSYYTDNLTTTLKKVSGASENARLTGNEPVSGLIDSLTFVVKYSGNVRAAGTVESIKFSTQGWKGTVGTANANETVGINLGYNKSTGLPEGLSASNLSNGAFSVSYPAGLIADRTTVATIPATWDKSDNLIAGDYQATITVTVNGN